MAMHGVTHITLAVPNVEETAKYYEDFGLFPLGNNKFGTLEGGHQLTVTYAPVRRLAEARIGVENPDDLGRAAASLRRFNAPVTLTDTTLATIEPITQTNLVLEIAPKVIQKPAVAPRINGPALSERPNERASAFFRTERVRPRRLGHFVLGSHDWEASSRFYIEGLGFRRSDTVKGCGTFMRCSTEHHNIYVLNTPVSFMHHTGWEVDDVDDVGRGAHAMLKGHPERHTWGLGRHYIGSNFFWYLRDPAGNFAEYYSDMDHIHDDMKWDAGNLPTGLGWSPGPPPPSFITPDDLAALMTGNQTGNQG